MLIETEAEMIPFQRLGTWLDLMLDRVLGLALVAALLMALLTAWSGQAQAAERIDGSGTAATEQRPLGGFSAVQTQGLKLQVRQGPVAQVVVTADANLLPLLETVVENNRHGQTLVVRWKSNTSLKTRVSPVVQVTAPELKTLVVSGSGDIVADELKLGALSARVEGSGDLRLNGLQADSLSLAVAGSGDIVASGQAARVSASIAGSGDIKTAALRADDVSVSIAGSGDADVQAQRTLTVKIAGSGDVRYTGAATVQRSIAGAGSVRQY